MATSSSYREIGDYVIDKDDRKCLGRTLKVCVYPGVHKLSDKKKVAGKMFVWDKKFPTDMVDREIANMKAIPPHENVLKLLDHDTIEVGKFKEIWLIIEHCQHGHMGDFVKRKQLSLVQKVDLMLQSAKGVQHLHHMDPPMIHRDIKPANLLITGDPGRPVVKVADYGESAYFQGSHEHSLRQVTAAGTPYYQAPELFSDPHSNRPKQNKAVDLFALGVSFLYVLDAEKDGDSTPIKVGKDVFGLHMHKNPNTDVRQLLTKPGDSEEVKQLKSLIAEMLVRDPNHRVLIDNVVERLREMRTAMGLKILLTVDTVWETPVFFLDTDLMDNIKTQIAAKQASKTEDPQASTETEEPQEPSEAEDPEQSPGPAYPPNANDALRMDHAERVTAATQDVLDLLRQIHAGGDTEGGQLLAVDVYDARGVWMHEGAEWERLCDVPDECRVNYVCMCRVSDGVIACGGENEYGEPVSQCHHFSVLTRQWKKLRDMITSRYGASAVEYDDMKLLVAGGWDRDCNTLAVCEVLDCKQDKWSPAPSMPKPLLKPLLAAESGRVCILPQIYDLQKTRLLVYDPSSKKEKFALLTPKNHTYKAALPTDVRSTLGACLVTAAHKLYLLGGKQGLTVEYDPLTDQWQHLTPPSLTYFDRYGCCAAVTPGLIRLCGGSGTAGQGVLDMVEVYDTRTRKWQTSDMRLPFKYWQWHSLVASFSHRVTAL